MKSSNNIKLVHVLHDRFSIPVIDFHNNSTAVDTSHNVELLTVRDPSLTSPVKIYVDGKQILINSNSTPIRVENIANEMNKVLGENKTINTADKEAHRASAYEIIRIAKKIH